MNATPGLIGAAVAVVAMTCATVAVCLHVIDGAAYVAVLGAFGGVGIGAGAHAAGVKQGSP